MSSDGVTGGTREGAVPQILARRKIFLLGGKYT